MTDNNIFNGFPVECVKYFTSLEINNNKHWFEEHRKDYDDYVLNPARQFVVAMGERLINISPKIIADPRIDKSIFRIFRDTRFSKDKRPYKTNLGIYFWEGKNKKFSGSGYYFHLESTKIFIAAGIYKPDPTMLSIYRSALIDDKKGAEFSKAVNKVFKYKKYLLGGDHYKRVPRGFDPKHKNAEYLRYNGFYAYEEMPLPKVIHSKKLLDFCFKKWEEMSPIHKWLVKIYS